MSDPPTSPHEGVRSLHVDDVRHAEPFEIDDLARLWHAGWQDAHATILPAELARHRTLESFRGRLAENLPHTRVVGPLGYPAGFRMVESDELYQLYVRAEARGLGIAAALLADGEQRIDTSGATTAWLACAIGNFRAARFYEIVGLPAQLLDRRLEFSVHVAE